MGGELLADLLRILTLLCGVRYRLLRLLERVWVSLLSAVFLGRLVALVVLEREELFGSSGWVLPGQRGDALD